MLSYFEKKRQIKEHRKIGFPSISREEQSRMLWFIDFTPVKALVEKQGPLYPELLDYYYDISNSEFAEFIIREKYWEEWVVNEEPQDDSISILREGDEYKLIDQERGVKREMIFNNLWGLALSIARLKLNYVPKYERNHYPDDFNPPLSR